MSLPEHVSLLLHNMQYFYQYLEEALFDNQRLSVVIRLEGNGQEGVLWAVRAIPRIWLKDFNEQYRFAALKVPFLTVWLPTPQTPTHYTNKSKI